MLLAKLNFFAMMLLQGSEVSFDLRSMWGNMGLAAKAVVVLLAIMSAWSIGVMIDRLMAYSAARKQSRQFAPAVAGVPLITPVEWFSATPAGSAPLIKLHVYGAVPPEAARVAV